MERYDHQQSIKDLFSFTFLLIPLQRAEIETCFIRYMNIVLLCTEKPAQNEGSQLLQNQLVRRALSNLIVLI